MLVNHLMRRVTFALCATILLLAGAAAAGTSSQLLVSTDWLHQHLGLRGLTVVEVGERAAFEQSHIPGARFVALTDLLTERDGIPNELPEIAALERTFNDAGLRDLGDIVIYSREIIPAARAFFTLDYLGCGNQTSILDGGFAKWSAEHRPVETGPVRQRLSSFYARPNPVALVRIGQMKILVPAAMSMSSALTIIDARPVEQYAGAESGAGVTRPGHITGAISVPWNMNLTSGAIPVFRDSQALREMYHDCGIGEEASVIAYCRTGMQASVTYFVLRYLGTDVHLYDGSYIEWNCAEATSIVAGSLPWIALTRRCAPPSPAKLERDARGARFLRPA
jgi:thiosulfate/3-mercaptopyruvate sulfurtransferase